MCGAGQVPMKTRTQPTNYDLKTSYDVHLDGDILLNPTDEKGHSVSIQGGHLQGKDFILTLLVQLEIVTHNL